MLSDGSLLSQQEGIVEIREEYMGENSAERMSKEGRFWLLTIFQFHQCTVSSVIKGSSEERDPGGWGNPVKYFLVENSMVLTPQIACQNFRSTTIRVSFGCR